MAQIFDTQLGYWTEPRWERLSTIPATIDRLAAITPRLVRDAAPAPPAKLGLAYGVESCVTTSPTIGEMSLLAGAPYEQWQLRLASRTSRVVRQCGINKKSYRSDMIPLPCYRVKGRHPLHPARTFFIGAYFSVTRYVLTGRVAELHRKRNLWSAYDAETGIQILPYTFSTKEYALLGLNRHMCVHTEDAVVEFLTAWAAHKASKMLYYASQEGEDA